MSSEYFRKWAHLRKEEAGLSEVVRLFEGIEVGIAKERTEFQEWSHGCGQTTVHAESVHAESVHAEGEASSTSPRDNKAAEVPYRDTGPDRTR